MFEVDASDRFEKAMNEVLSRLLAVGHDVEAGILLFLQHQHGRVALGCCELRPLRFPLRPELLRLCKPEWLWQTPGDRRFEHNPSVAHTRRHI